MEINIFSKSFWAKLSEKKRQQFINDVVIVELSETTFVVYSESDVIIAALARRGTFLSLEDAKLFAGALIAKKKNILPGMDQKATISDLIVASNIFQKRLNDFIKANTHLIS